MSTVVWGLSLCLAAASLGAGEVGASPSSDGAPALDAPLEGDGPDGADPTPATSEGPTSAPAPTTRTASGPAVVGGEQTSTDPTAATTTAAPTTSTTTTTVDPFGVGAPIDDLAAGSRPGTTFQTRPVPPPPTTTTTTSPPPPPPPPNPYGLPAGSGVGRRAVYSKSAQRVWAVDGANRVIKTHRVSGKLKWCDPRPGWYSVFSRSIRTYAIQNPSITWGYMVRFTKGCNGGNIGFHEIPFQYGRPVQSIAQLGQPLSGGCVRQARADAIWMWNWAGIGTRVVVLP